MYASLFLWLALLEALSFVVFPLAYRAFGSLPGRGYAFAKPLSLLLVAFVAWLAAFSTIIPNSRWSVLLAVIVAAALSWLAARRLGGEMLAFLRRERWLVLTTEAVFIGVFVAFALYRATTPEISHTEQPMDFMFLNALVTSPVFPPSDPWLAGEAVSYYYFGYWMIGALTLLSGLATPVAYNLGLATAAAMAGAAAFGVVVALVRRGGGSRAAAVGAGLGGVFLLLFASNLGGALYLAQAAGAGSAAFWSWLGIESLPPGVEASADWRPARFWWWFGASRIVPNAINEFPAFSFVLGDLHPHVMSIGFLLLALGAALALYATSDLLGGRDALRRQWPLLLAATLSLGALGAVNLWDLPTGAALMAGAALLNAARHGRRYRWRLPRAITAGALLCFILFFVWFESTADGVLPLGELLTRPPHMVLLWGAAGGLFLLLLVSVAPDVARVRGSRSIRYGVTAYVGLAPVILWFQPIWGPLVYVTIAMLGTLLGLFILRRTGVKILAPDEANTTGTGTGLTFYVGVAALLGLLVYDGVVNGVRGADGSIIVVDRLMIALPMTAIVIFAMYAAWSLAHRDGMTWGPRWEGAAPALAIGAVGAALVMGAELFHVVDFFGGDNRRMNTMFKLHYQAWTLFAVVGGFALWYVTTRLDLGRLRGRAAAACWAGILVVGLAALAYYPLAAMTDRARPDSPMRLDGQAGLAQSSPEEWAAIQWVRANLPRDAVLLEAAEIPCADASGGCSDWTPVGRVAGSTGRATLLGWEQHELQWRASGASVSGRRGDVRAIYEAQNAAEAAALLARYGVDYVYLGERERRAYGANGASAFAQLGSIVFGAGGGNRAVSIYHVGAETDGQ
ncbi:MAG: hypothetical protein J4F32_05650 [Dehalococcoidia bacterium]|nr:hypothetical protein [Dehalococcoidia bacterium]